MAAGSSANLIRRFSSITSGLNDWRCTSRSRSPNSAAVAGRACGSRDIACSITAHTSAGRPRFPQVRHRMLGDPQELGHHLLALSALERRVPRPGAKQRRRQAVDVRRPIRRLAQQHLRGGVGR